MVSFFKEIEKIFGAWLVDATDVSFTWHFQYVCVCVQISLFYKDTSHIRLGAHSMPIWAHLS